MLGVFLSSETATWSCNLISHRYEPELLPTACTIGATRLSNLAWQPVKLSLLSWGQLPYMSARLLFSMQAALQRR